MSQIPVESCNHPPDMRERKTQTIQGERVRVEVCTQCGLTVLNPLDAAELLSVRGARGSPLLRNAEEVVLALLGVIPDRPIINRLGVMKDAFLLEREAATEAGISLHRLGFFPHKQGPYSRQVSDAIDALAHEGLVSITTTPHGRQQTISLTDSGKKRARVITSRLGKEPVEKLARRRKAWDQLGYLGILRKVYEEYPPYNSESEIEDYVKPGGGHHQSG